MVIGACFAMLSAVPMMLLGGLQSSLWCRGKCLGPIQFVVSWQVPEVDSNPVCGIVASAWACR